MTNSLTTNKMNKSIIMKRAWYLFKNNAFATFSECLKSSWAIQKSQPVLNLDTLYKKYHNKLYNHVKFNMYGNSFDSDDIFSNVWIKVNNQLHTYKSEKSNIYTWLINIANSCITDWYRAKKASKRNTDQTTYISDFQKDNGEDYIDIPNQNESNLLESKELGDAMASAIKSLKPIEQKLIQLNVVDGYKYQEVSEMLEIPLNTVKVYIARAKAKLATKLQSYKYTN